MDGKEMDRGVMDGKEMDGGVKNESEKLKKLKIEE